MKLRNQAIKYGRKVAAVVTPIALSLGMSVANAAVDLSAEATSAKADVNTNGELIMGILFAVAVFAWLRRVIR